MLGGLDLESDMLELFHGGMTEQKIKRHIA